MKLTKQIREETKSLSYIINRNYLLQMLFLKLEHYIILILSSMNPSIDSKQIQIFYKYIIGGLDTNHIHTEKDF